jgi:hypothetical protein
MSATVAKSFNTPTRRWVAGEPITRADDIAPHNYDDFADRGFIDDQAFDRGASKVIRNAPKTQRKL